MNLTDAMLLERMQQMAASMALPQIGGLSQNAQPKTNTDGVSFQDLMDRAQLWLTKADGPTDGLVTPESAVWGRYRGTLAGISHQDSVDSRRRRPAVFSAEVFYTALVQELAEMGF